MKILLTGSSGFIGSRLLPLLEQRGHKVVTTTRHGERDHDSVFFDLNKSGRGLFEKAGKPDKLVHLAWQGLPNFNAVTHIEQVAGHFNFIKGLIDDGLKSVCVAGTCFEYGKQNGCLSENMETNPSTVYGVAKDSLRRLLEAYCREKSVHFKWIRYFYVYGEGQYPKALYSQLKRAVEQKEEFFPMSPGDQLRDFLTIEELSEKTLAIVEDISFNGVINCCSGKPLSVRGLVEKIVKDKGWEIQLKLGEYPYASYEPMAFWGDDEKLKRIISG